MATGVVYYDADGVEQFQPAEVVILACNGIGTPRLLLNSANARFPHGLANTSGLVGRNLMFHPYALDHRVFRRSSSMASAGRGSCIWSQEFYETDRSRGFVRGYSFEFCRGEGPVLAAIARHGSQAACRGAPSTTTPIAGCSADRTGMVAICEDLPEEHNRVTLDPVLTDGNGIPAPKIDYTLSENSRRMLDHAVARGSEILRAAGAHDVGARRRSPTAAGT